MITPFFSKRVYHAMVLKRKFIHIGRIKMKTTKLPEPIFLVLKIIASGYAIRRQMTVLTMEYARESIRAFIWSSVKIARTLSNVNTPLRSVRP